ncbi:MULTISPECIES: peroxidase-related enzyme [unclassified Leucobacter]|uniref:peroxidase-related enzyme n=1 Tax=unclassified Leucobacter TaxID=2621730 RepID=UPI00165DF1D8|nr:peroxidase-related enzyme [Leucobacter sp. CX169]MBC9926444.1 peroxidase-related enzyme [Leucobacter sp. cx-169]
MTTAVDSLFSLLHETPDDASLPGRSEVLAHTREAYAALYETPQALPASVLHGLATLVARQQGSEALAEHHARLADPALLTDELPADSKLRTIVEHVELITVSPALVEREDQLTLQLAGVTADEIVLISQVVAYESYLLRAAHGLELLTGQDPARYEGSNRLTVAHGRTPAVQSHTARGSEIPAHFTRDVLAWEPWVPAVPETELTAEQVESFAAKATTNSEYFRLLARTPAVLRARSALDNAVFLGRDGLPRGERELAAAVTSKVNDCIYCASVHARKAEFQTKRADDIDRLLAIELERDADWVAADTDALADGQDERWAAIVRFAARLSELRPSATTVDIEALRDVGLGADEIADAVFATAFFAWANRLMLSLGEPAIPGTEPGARA